MTMGISKLISEIGDENIKFQSLDNCMEEAVYDSKKGTTISFLTDANILTGRTKEIGVILWLPRGAVEKAIDAHNKEK
jgi:hypothetical protein